MTVSASLPAFSTNQSVRPPPTRLTTCTGCRLPARRLHAQAGRDEFSDGGQHVVCRKNRRAADHPSARSLECGQPLGQRRLDHAHRRDDHQLDRQVGDAKHASLHTPRLEDVRVGEVEVQMVLHQERLQPDVGLQVDARREAARRLDDQDLRVDVRALEEPANPIDVLGQLAEERPIGRLEEEGGRRIVLAQRVRAVEEAVRHQVVDARQELTVGHQLGVLQRAAPAQAVIALVQAAFFAVEVRGRGRGFGVLAQVRPQQIERCAGLGVPGSQPGMSM